jgi:hypothetical protein
MRYRYARQTCGVTTRVGSLSPKVMPRGLCKPSITHVSAALDEQANSAKPRPEAASGRGRAAISTRAATLEDMRRTEETTRLEMRDIADLLCPIYGFGMLMAVPLLSPSAS